MTTLNAGEGKVEELARAIHEGLGGDGWAYTDYGRDEWNSQRDDLMAAARALLAALRTPSEEMVEAMGGLAPLTDAERFTAAIDVLLTPKDPEQ